MFFFITNSDSSVDSGLFKFPITSSVRFGNLYLLRNLFHLSCQIYFHKVFHNVPPSYGLMFYSMTMVMCVFSFFPVICAARDLLILLIFSKNQYLVSLINSVYVYFIFHWFLFFIIFFLLLIMALIVLFLYS